MVSKEEDDQNCKLLLDFNRITTISHAVHQCPWRFPNCVMMEHEELCYRGNGHVCLDWRKLLSELESS